MWDLEQANGGRDATPRPGSHAVTGDADGVARDDGGETSAPTHQTEAAPEFEDWLLGVTSWYVSQKGSRMGADTTPVPVGL